jgi:hypothetical protein
VKNPLLYDFLTVRPIFTINISIDPGRRAEKVEQSKRSKFHARGATGDFCEKNNPKNNFSTNEPISANNIFIDSARQAETHKKFKKFSNVMYVGEQPGNFHGKMPPE